MESITTIRKLKLNKKTISTLNNYQFTRQETFNPEECKYTVNCTYPECASEPSCRTNNLQSCAPCVPPKGESIKC